MSYDWSMVSKHNQTHRLIASVAHARYTNNPRNLSAESYYSGFPKFLEWGIDDYEIPCLYDNLMANNFRKRFGGWGGGGVTQK